LTPFESRDGWGMLGISSPQRLADHGLTGRLHDALRHPRHGCLESQMAMVKSETGWWYTYPSEKYESQWEGLENKK